MVIYPFLSSAKNDLETFPVQDSHSHSGDSGSYDNHQGTAHNWFDLLAPQQLHQSLCDKNRKS